MKTLTGFLFLMPRPSAAQAVQQPPPVVRSWEIVGNQAVPGDSIRSWVMLRPGSAWTSTVHQADLDRIRSRYRAEGFLEAKILADEVRPTTDSTAVDVSITLQENRRAVVGLVRITGTGTIEEAEVRSALGLITGEAFSVASFEEGIRQILRSYERNGLPLAKAAITEFDLQERDGNLAVDVTIAIEEGPEALVTGAKVSGNERTREEVITRELRLGHGRPFDPDLPARVRRTLERLDIFSSVSEPEYYVQPDGSLGLAISIREGNTNRFDGAVGYVPAAVEGQTGTVTGLLEFGFKNLFGTGRRLDARWRRIDRMSQDLALRYKEPWLFGLPVSAAGSFAQRKQDSSYVQRGFDLIAELMITDEFSLALSFATTSVVPGQLATPAVTKNSSTGFALSVLYDSRDRPIASTGGALFQTSYERGSKRIEAGPLSPLAASESRDRITADVEAYFLIRRPHVIAVAAHGRDIRTGALEVSDLYRLGGARTLRGYGEDQFMGSRVVWTNLEYRFLAGNRSYLYGFFDWGYVAVLAGDSSPLDESELRPYGYGAGLLVETILGIVDVSIAAGEDDTFSTAKFHLRLINEF